MVTLVLRFLRLLANIWVSSLLFVKFSRYVSVSFDVSKRFPDHWGGSAIIVSRKRINTVHLIFVFQIITNYVRRLYNLTKMSYYTAKTIEVWEILQSRALMQPSLTKETSMIFQIELSTKPFQICIQITFTLIIETNQWSFNTKKWIYTFDNS